MKIKFKPVAMLENYIAKKFNLDKKGTKLLSVGFTLSGATFGVLLLQVATLVAYCLNHYLWWVPSLPVLGWAWWRFLIRYFDSKAFLCGCCGRTKLWVMQTFNDTHQPRNVCTECEKRSGIFVQFSKTLEQFKEELDFFKKHPPD